jgi:phosphoserine phosphatase
MEAKPIFFVDMEGTLFRKSPVAVSGKVSPSAWGTIAKLLGEDAFQEAEEGKAKWNRGEFAGYVEWMEYAVRSYKTHQLRKDTFDKVLSTIEYHPGVFEVFQQIRAKYRTALISGGLKAQADRAQRDLKIDHAFSACELFWDADGFIDHWNLLPCDYEGKADFMQLIMKEHKAKAEDCVFIGDGFNDITLAKAVGTSIAFNGHPELQKATTHSVNQPEGQEDFRAILTHIPS